MKLALNPKPERDYRKIPQLITVGMVNEITHLRKQIDDAISLSPTLPLKEDTSSPRHAEKHLNSRRAASNLRLQNSRDSMQTSDNSHVHIHYKPSSRNTQNRSVADIPCHDYKEISDIRKYRCASIRSPPNESLITSINFLRESRFQKVLEDRSTETARRSFDNNRHCNSILFPSSVNTPKVVTNAIPKNSNRNNPFFHRKKVTRIHRKLKISEMLSPFEQEKIRLDKSFNLTRSNKFSYYLSKAQIGLLAIYKGEFSIESELFL